MRRQQKPHKQSLTAPTGSCGPADCSRQAFGVLLVWHLVWGVDLWLSCCEQCLQCWVRHQAVHDMLPLLNHLWWCVFFVQPNPLYIMCYVACCPLFTRHCNCLQVEQVSLHGRTTSCWARSGSSVVVHTRDSHSGHALSLMCLRQCS